MREIEASVKKDENPRAKLSLEMYFYRLRKYIGAYAAVLNGLDILVITGGIGENCRDISTGLCHGLDYLGLEIEDEKAFNLQQKEMILSTESSRVTAMIIPTNEELVIAEETWDLISNN
jgi:acetate kinase